MVQIAWLTLLGFSNHQQNQYAADKAFPITEISSAIRAQVDLPGHMEFFLLVYRAPVYSRSGVFQPLPISYSLVGLFIRTDAQNSQIFASLHKTWIWKANSYHHYMLWSLALGHHWQHYFPIFPFISQPLLTYSSASGYLLILRRDSF